MKIKKTLSERNPSRESCWSGKLLKLAMVWKMAGRDSFMDWKMASRENDSPESCKWEKDH